MSTRRQPGGKTPPKRTRRAQARSESDVPATAANELTSDSGQPVK